MPSRSVNPAKTLILGKGRGKLLVQLYSDGRVGLADERPGPAGRVLGRLSKGTSRKIRKAAHSVGLLNIAAAPRESAERVEHVIRNLVNKRKSAADSKSGR